MSGRNFVIITQVVSVFVLVISGILILKNPVNDETVQKQRSAIKVTPNDWMAMQRTFPHGRINPEAWLAAVGQAEQLIKDQPARNNPWTFAGPDNIGGRITDIESPANDLNTIYVGASTGGILKTTDGGMSWTNLFDDLPVVSVGDIALDPRHPDTIWCGMGEANSASYSFLGNGIYRSTDAGETWQHMGLTNSAYIGRVVVDHSNSSRIFAAACGNLFTTSGQRGVYRSNDFGQTWERVLYLTDSTAAIDLVQHPVNAQIIYAAMWERSRGLTYRNSFGASSGIWKSIDGGTTWNELTTGLPSGNEVGRIGIDISRSNPDILYAFYDLPYDEVAVYKSTDGGATWTRTNDGTLYGNNSNFGWYFGQIRVDPSNANRVFVMGVSLFRTENGGNSWSSVGGWSLHVDHHAMLFTGNNRILQGNDGGFYISTNNGNSWDKVNNLPITQFYAIDIDYQNPERIYGGTQDNNTLRTWYGGTNDWEAILGGDGMYCLVDHSNSNIIYAEYQWGNLHRADDGGFNMQYIAGPMSGDRVNWSAPLAMHPVTPSTLYFGTYRVWKTTDKGNNWVAVSPDLTAGIENYFYTVTTIDISRVNPSIVVAGTGDGKVQVSANDGLTWQDISAGLPERWITRVKTDPFDAQTIYVTISGFRWDEPLPHVFKTTDLGQTWISITGNLPEFPVNDIVADPDIPGRLIVGTDAGLYGTTDGGQNWSWVWDGLPAVPVCALKIHAPSRTIVAGTYGLSCYRASLDDILTGIPAAGEPAKIRLTVYPNPVMGAAKIGFYLPADEFVTAYLADLSGKNSKQIWQGRLSRGNQLINFDTEGLHGGIYVISVEGKGFSGEAKLIKLN